MDLIDLASPPGTQHDMTVGIKYSCMVRSTSAVEESI